MALEEPKAMVAMVQSWKLAAVLRLFRSADVGQPE
jgi:hypothetical protein